MKQQIRIKELEAAIKEQKANIQAARVASGSDGRGRYSSEVPPVTKQINQWKADMEDLQGGEWCVVTALTTLLHRTALLH